MKDKRQLVHVHLFNLKQYSYLCGNKAISLF